MNTKMRKNVRQISQGWLSALYTDENAEVPVKCLSSDFTPRDGRI